MSTAVDIDGITTEWLSEALDRDVRVLSYERIGTGQTAATYRLEVQGQGIPSSLVAKAAAGDEATRRRVRGGFRSEVGFYGQLQSTVKVRAPFCWYAVATDDALQFTLLLEDLAPRVPGVQVDGCSTTQAGDSIRNLAALHAPRWNDATLFELDFLERSDAQRAAFLGPLARSAAQLFVDRHRDALSAPDRATLQASAEAVETWLTLRPEPFSVFHGDYRLDNLMFAPVGPEVVAVDWQTLMVGPPVRDLAYFLGNSLTVDARRAAEVDLVTTYHDALVSGGVAKYDVERCFEDYRLGHLQGPMITTIGAAYATAERTARSDAMFVAMARRSCAAIRDLQSLELL